jgi:hypothetical protein
VSGIANVTSPPYDVISGGSLEHLRASDPHNVVRLILPGEDVRGPDAAAMRPDAAHYTDALRQVRATLQARAGDGTRPNEPARAGQEDEGE